jgi:putative protein-disulfide isomerase
MIKLRNMIFTFGIKPWLVYLLFVFLCFSSYDLKKIPSEKPEIIYVYDPLCGWCYGFTPVMLKLKEKYGDSIKFSVVSGGMMIGERQGPVGEIAPFIKSAHKQIEETTNVKFGDRFINVVLEDGKMFFSSKPPSLALTVFKSLNKDQSLEYAHAIQKMIYYDGKDLNQISSYTGLLDPFGIDSSEFVKRFNDSTYKVKTSEDFKYAAFELKVDGYPAVFLKKGNKIKAITRGYDNFVSLDKKIKSCIR